MNHPIIKLLKESKYDITTDGKDYYHELMMIFLNDLSQTSEFCKNISDRMELGDDIIFCNFNYDKNKKEMYFIDYFSDNIRLVFNNVFYIRKNEPPIYFLINEKYIIQIDKRDKNFYAISWDFNLYIFFTELIENE